MQYISTLCALSAFLNSALAQLYIYDRTIPWAPKQALNVDQSQVYKDTYYLSDRTNAGVNVVNLTDYTQIALVTGPFIEADINGTFSSHVSGPNGLIIVSTHDEIWAGNGLGHVEVISAINHTVLGTIQTGGAFRADEGGYDPVRDVVAICHPDEVLPYVAIISAVNRTVIGNITFPGAVGLEQTAYNTADGTFYQSVPYMPAYPGGAICKLNIDAMAIGQCFPLYQCSPAGIAFGPNGNLYIACDGTFQTSDNYAVSYIMDTASNPGAILANISNLTGSDQAAYDAGTNLYYSSASAYLIDNMTSAGFIGIINAGSMKLVQSILSDNSTAHSLAVNPTNGELLVPVKEHGIVAYKLQQAESSGNASTISSGPKPSVTLYTGGTVSNVLDWSFLSSVLVVVMLVSLVLEWP